MSYFAENSANFGGKIGTTALSFDKSHLRIERNGKFFIAYFYLFIIFLLIFRLSSIFYQIFFNF